MLMGLINAVFAPFIVLYLLMYSFFRYFEVRSFPAAFLLSLIFLTLPKKTGIPQKPLLNRFTTIHPFSPLAIPRVQRTPPPLPPAPKPRPPPLRSLRRPISQRKNRLNLPFRSILSRVIRGSFDIIFDHRSRCFFTL